MTFRATVLTLYPEMFPGPLGTSLAGKALTAHKNAAAGAGAARPWETAA